MNSTWWKQAVVYQIYPRSFQDSNGDGIGDLRGIIARLPYLRQLGVDVLWLSPFYPSPGLDNGYDISDYQGVDPQFGTLADFDELLREAHSLRLRIVIDLVVNHTSDQHPWFRESRKSRDNPYRDYYIWRDGKGGGPPNNWGSCFSGSAWKLDEATGQYYLHCFGDFQPDLNWENPVLRREIYRMMRFWCDRGVDGFRMDVISMISKRTDMPDGPIKLGSAYGDFAPFVVNGPHVHCFLREMNREVLSRFDLLTVGECSGLTVREACRYANLNGSELSMAFQFEHMDLDGGESFKWNRRKIDLRELKQTLTKWQLSLAGKAWNSLYWCNHDQPRIVSRLGDDRSDENREKSAKALALCLHLMQGTPYIYQGEELGMTNGEFCSLEDFRDVESLNAFHELTESGVMDAGEMLACLRYKSRDNARTPMQWDASENAGFSTGEPWLGVNPNYQEINAEEQVGRPDSVFHFYRELIAFRHAQPIVTEGSFTLLWPEDAQLFGYIRASEDRELLAVCNLSPHPVAAEPPARFAGQKPVLTNDPALRCTRPMTLAPWQAFAVFAKGSDYET